MIKVAKPTPTVRFQDFSDNWEQHKVGELLIERNEQAPQSEEYPLMAFVANKGIAAKGERYDRSALVKDTKGKLYKKTELDDFIYSSNNLESGSIGLNKYGKASISPVYSIFKSSNIADLDFIGRRFIRKDFINNMIRWRQGVIYGQWRIHESDFLKIKVLIPSIDEQRKIGEYFSKLDSLITFYQRKLEQQKQLKQYFLQNMFPADGEKVPRIRFEGFTGDWEQRKLGELARFSKGLGYSKSDLQPFGTPIILYGRLYTKYETIIKDIDTFVNANDGAVYSQGGEVIVPASGETAEDISIASVVEKSGIILGGDLNIIHPNDNLDSTFLAISVSNGEPHRDMARRAQGKSVVHLHNDDLSQIKLRYPSLAEQHKISQYLCNIENLISSNQHKINQLQTLKKYMLQNMFI